MFAPESVQRYIKTTTKQKQNFTDDSHVKPMLRNSSETACSSYITYIVLFGLWITLGRVGITSQ